MYYCYKYYKLIIIYNGQKSNKLGLISEIKMTGLLKCVY